MKQLKIILFIIPIIFINSCSDDLLINNSEIEQKSILKFFSSFEEQGEASIKGWETPGPPVVKLTSAPAPYGGKYSILLKSFEMGAFAKREFSAEPGINHYKFSIWGKSEGTSSKAALFIKRNNEKIPVNSVFITGNNWSEYYFEEKIEVLNGDIFLVELSGVKNSSTQIITWFDLCKLEEILE